MARQALGKGFQALIPKVQTTTPASEAKEGDGALMVKVDDITPSPFQPRRHFDEEQIQELADSIRENGLMQPLVVRRMNGSYELIAGERRLRAMRHLGRKEVMVVIQDASDVEVAKLTLIENLQREDLSPIEIAEQFRKLQTEFGMKQEEIARSVGKSRVVVTNMMRLLDLDPVVREMLEKAIITVGHGKVLLQLKDPKLQVEAARRVEKSSLTVRQTEALVAKLLAPEPKPAPGREELPPVYRSICEQLSGDFGTKVNISFRGKSNGIIEIPYAGKEDLVRILQLFGISATL
ncbi:MAG: ParB/RepB/Spo0J family partition protein [Akkermansia sp.]|nr:ParB/RepB/Spo0J family partition protein [Akkermansia sp.]